MRILGVSKKDWINNLTGKPKLEEDEFTTFRFTRKDKDWQVGEVVQVVYKPRGKGGGEKLGIARIVAKEGRFVNTMPQYLYGDRGQVVSNDEGLADGFTDTMKMTRWMWDRYKNRIFDEPMNKLTLRWLR